jgi:hypothetical protein
MSRPFAKNNGKTTFSQFINPVNASDYTSSKKIKNIFCPIKPCVPLNKNLYSQSYYISNKLYKSTIENPYDINKTQLNINLITKLDLSGNVIVVTDLSGNGYPVEIDSTVVPFLKYNIDPSGNLFGNTVCGIDNFQHYIVCNNSSGIDYPGTINNL